MMNKGSRAYLTAAEMADIEGPDTPGCDCPQCHHLRAVKKLIVPLVTMYEAEQLATGKAENEISAWAMALSIAAGRLSQAGCSYEMACEIMVTGAEKTAEANQSEDETTLAMARPRGHA